MPSSGQRRKEPGPLTAPASYTDAPGPQATRVGAGVVMQLQMMLSPADGVVTVIAMISYEWRGPVRNPEMNALHAEGFDHPLLDDDWEAQLAAHSLGWVGARDDGTLVGFVNVAWDGGVHAFVLDTMVATPARSHGIGTRMVAIAAEHARAAGCEWLHVDFEEYLRSFYLDSCRFRPAPPGLIALSP
jgi:GNAT superfamily N-acetyltransferase